MAGREQDGRRRLAFEKCLLKVLRVLLELVQGAEGLSESGSCLELCRSWITYPPIWPVLSRFPARRHEFVNLSSSFKSWNSLASDIG